MRQWYIFVFTSKLSGGTPYYWVKIGFKFEYNLMGIKISNSLTRNSLKFTTFLNLCSIKVVTSLGELFGQPAMIKAVVTSGVKKRKIY
jgi:hypothetical protein